jgi:hypothetical protein
MARRNTGKPVATGGVLAALAVVVMAMGGMIPVATFACPVICMLLLKTVRNLCGDRMAWAWYGAVAILCALLAPDKEAAAVFVFLGYYPILKPRLDRCKAAWLWKLLLFNAAILTMYALLIRLFGMEQIAREYAEMGFWMTLVTLILGNATFVLLDIALGRKLRVRRG